MEVFSKYLSPKHTVFHIYQKAMYVNRNSRRENGSGRTQDFLPKADNALKSYSDEKEK